MGGSASERREKARSAWTREEGGWEQTPGGRRVVKGMIKKLFVNPDQLSGLRKAVTVIWQWFQKESQDLVSSNENYICYKEIREKGGETSP